MVKEVSVRDWTLGSRRNRRLIALLASWAVGLVSPLAAQGRQLNGPLPPDGDVARFSISADGKHVLYAAIESPQNQLDLFSVRLDARTPRRKLNRPLSPFFQVAFEIARTSGWSMARP
jgi:hypothetical protein